jgi:hypothetical protein
VTAARFAIALLTITACAHGATMTTRDRSPTEEVQATVTRVPHTIDAKQWTELRALYADEVATDYTSLFGGAPQRQSGDALIEGWRGALAHVVTQHLLGPIDVTISDTRARAECHVFATHHAAGAPGGADWTVLGHYVFDLALRDGRWRITAMKLETIHQIGNTKLLSEAAT